MVIKPTIEFHPQLGSHFRIDHVTLGKRINRVANECPTIGRGHAKNFGE
jgi:hypothetical protein